MLHLVKQFIIPRRARPLTSFPETEFFGGLARIGKNFFAHGPLRSFATPKKFAERHGHIRQNRPHLATLIVEHMLVLFKFTIFRPMQAIFDFPMTQNQILEFRNRNRIRVETRNKITSFIRLKFASSADFLIKTDQNAAARNAKLFSYKFGGPLFDP